MFKPVRLIATAVFLGSVGLVFVGAFVLGNEVCAPHPVPTTIPTYITSPGSMHQ
jgi:hypothetical protein